MTKLRVRIETEGLNLEEQGRVAKAAKHIEKALNSLEFKEFCSPYIRGGGVKYVRVRTSPIWRFWNRTYKTIKKEVPISGYGFKKPNGLTDQEVYEKIMLGAEILDPTDDREADIYLKIDRRNKRGVIGYTYGNTKWQWIYNWYFKSYTIPEMAGNLAHEWCHKLGFGHDHRWNSTREHTVPYAVGYFVRDYKEK